MALTRVSTSLIKDGTIRIEDLDIGPIQAGQLIGYNGTGLVAVNSVMQDAPSDNMAYVRKNGTWEVSSALPANIYFEDLVNATTPALANGYFSWDSTATNIVFSTTIPVSNVTGLADVATSGDFFDLTNVPSITNDLSLLNDVDVGSATTNQILRYDGSKWVASNETSGPAGGEINTASNIGAGAGLFSAKVGSDLRFKSISSGSNIQVTIQPNTISIAVVGLGNGTMGGLSDVDNTSYGNGSAFNYVLTWNGLDKWSAAPVTTYTPGNGLNLVSNQFNVVGSSNISVSTNINLTTTGVVAGEYTKLTTDQYGRITSATNLVEADIPALSANKIASGVLSPSVLGSGTADSTTYLRGDGQWQSLDNYNELSAMNDVSITSPQSGDTLYYNGTNWQNISNGALSVYKTMAVKYTWNGSGWTRNTDLPLGWTDVSTGTEIIFTINNKKVLFINYSFQGYDQLNRYSLRMPAGINTFRNEYNGVNSVITATGITQSNTSAIYVSDPHFYFMGAYLEL